MPAPIAISRTPSDVDSFGSPRNSLGRSNGGSGSSSSHMSGLSSSIMGASSGSFREAIAASFGKEASDIMDYSISRFSSSHASTDSDMTALPSTSFPRTKLETTFCRNFKCCGQGLENLHDLLQHYEEKHVKFEDDEVPQMVTDDDNSNSSSASSSQPPSPKSTAATKASSDAPNDTFEESSAFDTAIMRSSPVKGGKKRSFGQFSNGSNSATVHQSLRRALIDGGVGRSSSRTSSIYSANSPFSTPGSSLPGTPKLDNDGETAFFGNGSNNIPAFSSLSIRGAGEDHDLPSCAPPNLFFPAAGGSSSVASLSAAAPATKRERISSTSSAISASGLLDNGVAGPGGALGDRPYKCQSPGCDKAYKQMNGLKYHRLHGQCNQNMLAPAAGEKDKASAPASSTSAPAAAATPAAAPAISASTLNALSAALSEAAAANRSAAAAATTAKTSATSTTTPVIATAISTSPEAADGITTPSPSSSTPGSPRSSCESLSGDSSNSSKADRAYLCQVGSCGKRYKNLNGLRYHYHHSGSHGLLGLQLLSSNGGGPSARADVNTGRPAISTNDLSSTALAAAAQAAAAQLQANRRNAAMQQDQQQTK